MNDDKIRDAVAASVDVAEVNDDTQKIIVRAQHSTAVELRKVIDAAKAGDQKAINKLKIFETIKDPNLAARLAIMNRAQRTQYLAGMKKVAKLQRKRARRRAGSTHDET